MNAQFQTGCQPWPWFEGESLTPPEAGLIGTFGFSGVAGGALGGLSGQQDTVCPVAACTKHHT